MDRAARGVLRWVEEHNCRVDLGHFHCGEDGFCICAHYSDDLMVLAKMVRAAGDNEKTMRTYLGKGEVEHEK